MGVRVILIILSSCLLCGCAHGGTDATESTGEDTPRLFWESSGVPKCPYESLGSVDARNSRLNRELLNIARLRGADAVIKVTRIRGPSRDAIRGELIRFTDPDCRY